MKNFISNKNIEVFGYRGFIKIISEENGVETEVVNDYNLTTTLSSNVLANMLKQLTLGTSDGYEITEMHFSNMGSDELVDTVPEVDPDNEGMIGTSIDVIEISSAEVDQIDEDDVVIFQATMDKDENNGKTYTEVGLFTEEGTLFAKKHFPSYQKNSNRKLTVLWGIHFQRLTS